MKDAKTMAQQALDVQDACNLSGVAHGFSQTITDLRQAAPGHDTDWYNYHPIAVMWADKIASLAGVQNLDCSPHYSNAHQWCSNVAEGKRPNNFEYEESK